MSFELDLYGALQRHYDFDTDYVKRKPMASGIKVSAIVKGKTEALDLWEPLQEGALEPAFLERYQLMRA